MCPNRRLCPEKALPQIRSQNLKPVGAVCVGLLAGQGEEHDAAGESVLTTSPHAGAITHRREICPQVDSQMQRFVRVISEMRNLVWEHMEFQTQGPASAVFVNSGGALWQNQSVGNPEKPLSVEAHASSHQVSNGVGTINSTFGILEGNVKTTHRDCVSHAALGYVKLANQGRVCKHILVTI
ncbi:unnamed protein product [Schistocephalus solidus]|uniref:Uncharacterized protein n=1 Tax=Schistocephalus solidus TaxID=70667 RepID=A0A183SLD9_SCHSO|nr:unnamed protein product [Schistocephalus solidus]